MISIAPLSAAGLGVKPVDGVPVPLSDHFNTALAEAYVWAGQERAGILAAANNPAVASDPDSIYALQLRQEAYIKTISFGAAVTSHMTKAAETLLKS
ncbi:MULTISPECIES: hypothetical protein [unclassified Stenotrophomonas]|jgi:hypothetical protein|uniref:hypothetical protein n=1 Tax=unclassified Stenotrophomonas TaxID=196198 RepID=UPI0005AF268E|nr:MULTISPECIES: hypothetical protein [unclassified Stenotrophomonas]KIP87792.1 hypothetical protein SN15_00225 [Stenotrophomonas maltophilia]MBD8644948.1 hypothetical protein [Stenotrophomonas sp. CFBP 13724]MDY1034410.1 hypothetical protein [Stenotrophomonas sp. CFBP8980]